MIGLKLLSNEVTARISCRLRFSATMAFSFVEADEEFNEELGDTSENKNTKRSTDYWTNIFQQWAKTRGKNMQLESYEVPELNEALAQFFAEPRKENGKDCFDNFALYVINNSDNVVKTLKIHVKLFLNCSRAHAITYTKTKRAGGPL